MGYPGPRPTPRPRPTRFSDDVATAVNLSVFRIGKRQRSSLLVCDTIDVTSVAGDGAWWLVKAHFISRVGNYCMEDVEFQYVRTGPRMPEPPPPVPLDAVNHWTGEVTQLDRSAKSTYTLQPRTDWVRLGMWLTAGIVATATVAAIAGF